MTNNSFKFYSVLKNEDANPYIGSYVIAVADGLGGSGSAVHTVDRAKHVDMRGDIMASAFGDMREASPEFWQYIEELIAPMADGKDDTSALWASRIVIARLVYALTEGGFKNVDLSDKYVRANLSEFIEWGLHKAAEKFNLKKGKYDGQLLLPTTLAFIRYTEKESSVTAEIVWAGDSRCYALTPDGLKLLSVDDEDNSGSITNLFYAGNKNASLNYVCREIAKPCALMAVSDGIFDPFCPHENLGVEYILLSTVKESNSIQEVATALNDFYKDVHGDDATMAFVPFGFDSFEDMQKKLAERTDEILAVHAKQGELYGALEVINQTEEEASHYVFARANDRFDYIADILTEAMESGAEDIALTLEATKIAAAVKKDNGAAIVRAKKQKEAQALTELYNHVINHPELVPQIFMPREKIDFGSEYHVAYSFPDLWKNAENYVAAVNDGELKEMQRGLGEKREALHQRITERINFYRNRFDELWKDKSPDYKLRQEIKNCLRIWENIDFYLQYTWRPSDIGNLPDQDLTLAYEARDFIEEEKGVNKQINDKKAQAESSYSFFVSAWNKVHDYLKRCPSAITVILTSEAVRNFGFGESDESIIAEFGKNARNKILAELKAKKTDVVYGIVKSLAENYEKTSLIDGQFNATKLELFRTYFRLKASDSGEAKALEEKLSALEEEYISLIKNEKFNA
ncbi:MAG: hypothetical protein NC311_07845 [Muribaculaceae bacterium]|nr:hypothetical protein [Muribaculaceae bacterium]MCM1440387.1 hypothetical protein [Roseburia sp.]